MAQAGLLKREGLLLRAKGQELVLKSQKLLPSQPPTKPALRKYFEELVNLTQVREGHARVIPTLLFFSTKPIPLPKRFAHVQRATALTQTIPNPCKLADYG